jgi:diguanylate cyclase (GGDEF)-like protein/putative nucleotidyltransferase with HDIG domain
MAAGAGVLTPGEIGREGLDERMQRAIDRLGPLPVLDGTVQRVLALAADADADTGELAVAVERDAAFSANLLRAANSANSARRAAAVTIPQALVVVGRGGLRRVALEAATYRLLERVSHGETPAALHAHAVAVAAHAATLAERGGLDPALAHLAGLLHDLGKVVLPMVVGAAAMEDAVAGAGRLERIAQERRALGIDHAAAGAALARAWELEPTIAEAIARHHGPTPAGGITGCVQVANELVHMLAGGATDAALLGGALDALGLPAEVFDDLVMEAAGGRQGEVDAVRAQMRELEERANLDGLTGIANRRHWSDLVAERLRGPAQGALLMVDVDEFKQVNDTHGHAAGDEVLRLVARALAPHGIAGRLGGDEFALWTPLAPDAAQNLAQAILHEVRGRTTEVLGGRACGVSIGIAATPAGADLHEALEAADAALYGAKKAGRGRAHHAGSAPKRGAGHPSVPVARTAGEALRRVLAAQVGAVGVRGRAREPVEGVRAAQIVDRALDALCADPDAVDLVLRHALQPALLAHGMQTAALATVTGCRLYWDDERLGQLVVAALLADVGMTLVRPGLREKPGALMPPERHEVMRHCETGADLLAAIAERWPVAAYVAYEHHEMWDGSGYPSGLSGDGIRDESQMVGLCHRYLAAVTPRPHRSALPPHEAMELLFTLHNGLARADVVHAFTEAVAIYPVGSFVRLSNGLSGRVLPGGAATRPRVLALWERDGGLLSRREMISLGEHPTLFVTGLAA